MGIFEKSECQQPNFDPFGYYFTSPIGRDLDDRTRTIQKTDVSGRVI